jgi:Glycosyltransferase family 92
MTAYLAACATYRDHASYLVEWIEFHRLVGVERFFLYNNLSRDEHREILAPYVEDGIVVVRDWPHQHVRTDGRPHGILLAYDHCLETHGHESRWMTFLDIDEFLFSPTGEPVTEIVRDYERWPGIVVSRADFGPSGHRTRPPGLVIENFLRRRRYRPDAIAPVKSIVDPGRTVRSASIHHFHYRDGVAVDENMQPVESASGRRNWVSFERLRINHYGTKSEAEMAAKQELWESIGYPRGQASFEKLQQATNEYDDVITSYAPALRDAVKRFEPTA